MNLIEGLTNFNLTKQEATLYVLLLKSGQMTGYEAAKQPAFRAPTPILRWQDWWIREQRMCWRRAR